MPPKLSQTKRDLIEILFHSKTLHNVVADIAKYSVATVKLMSQNLSHFGILYAPKIKSLGASIAYPRNGFGIVLSKLFICNLMTNF